jgi:polar amino acid transport system substrate-binding protein
MSLWCYIKSNAYHFTVSCSFCVSVVGILAVSGEGTASALRVGIPVQDSEPYVFKQGDTPEGIVIELWKDIATQKELEYEWIPQTNYGEAITAVEQGELDIFVAPTSITAERLQQVEFTMPFDEAQVTLLIPRAEPGLWSRLRPFVGLAAISSLGTLVFSAFIVGNLMWWVEHKKNAEHFPPNYIQGIGNGMWFAMVTLTTVGYGDRAPATPAGRFIATTWMLIALLAVSSITAGLASALTISLSNQSQPRFTDVGDLRQARIASIRGSGSSRWATYYGAKLIEVESIEDGAETVVAGNAEAFISHHSSLSYYISQNPQLDLAVSQLIIATEFYGFALPKGSELTQPLDVTLMQLREDGKVQSLKDQWF